MATAKQVEANRSNARKSTGPRSDAGKAAARYNALVHGFRARGLDVLPQEDAALFRDRLDAWIADYDPADEAEGRLVRRAATLAWKLDRAERIEAARLAARAREAIAQAEADFDDRLDEAVYGLFPDPENADRIDCADRDERPAAELLETIRGSAEGCRWLAAQWKHLRHMLLHVGPAWPPASEARAIRLLGGGPGPIADPILLVLVVANRVGMTGGPLDPLDPPDAPPGITFDREAIRDACRRQPSDPAAAKALLMATAAGAIAELEALAGRRDRDGDAWAGAIAEAADLASFDPGREGESLRRHESALHREFLRTVESLDKRRLQRARLDRERAKGEPIRANEPNLEVASSQIGAALAGKPPVAPEMVSAVEIRANEPNPGVAAEGQPTLAGKPPAAPEMVSAVENRANEPNPGVAAEGQPTLAGKPPVAPGMVSAVETRANEAKLSRRQIKRLLKQRRRDAA